MSLGRLVGEVRCESFVLCDVVEGIVFYCEGIVMDLFVYVCVCV